MTLRYTTDWEEACKEENKNKIIEIMKDTFSYYSYILDDFLKFSTEILKKKITNVEDAFKNLPLSFLFKFVKTYEPRKTYHDCCNETTLLGDSIYDYQNDEIIIIEEEGIRYGFTKDEFELMDYNPYTRTQWETLIKSEFLKNKKNKKDLWNNGEIKIRHDNSSLGEYNYMKSFFSRKTAELRGFPIPYKEIELLDKERLVYQYKSFYPNIEHDYEIQGRLKTLTILYSLLVGDFNYMLGYRNQESYEIYLNRVFSNGLELRLFPDNIRDDEEIVFYAVKNNGHSMQYASERLKNDVSFVFRIVNSIERDIKMGIFFKYVSDKITSKFLLEAIKISPSILQCAPDNIKSNPQIVSDCVSKDARTLEFASSVLKNKTEIFKASLTGIGIGLKFTSFRIRDNFDLVYLSVVKRPRSLEYASLRLRKSYGIVYEAIKEEPTIVQFISEELRDNYELMLMAIKKNGANLKYLSNRLKNNETIVSTAIELFGQNIKFASRYIKCQAKLVHKAVSRTGWALKFASNSLRNKKWIVKTAVAQSGEAFKYASPQLRDDWEIASLAMKTFAGSVFRYASPRLRGDPQFILNSLEENEITYGHHTITKAKYCAFNFISEELKNDVTFVRKAMLINPKIYTFLNEEVRKDEIITQLYNTQEIPEEIFYDNEIGDFDCESDDNI